LLPAVPDPGSSTLVGQPQLPVRRLPPPPALLEANNPAAPSASLTADDVVLKLQAMAAAQGSSALQQHLQTQQAKAATSSAASPASANGNHPDQGRISQATPGAGTAAQGGPDPRDQHVTITASQAQ
jgi:hypothetical protein